MKKIIFIWVLSLILLSSVSVSAQTVPKDTSQVTQDILKLKAQNDTLKMEFEKVGKNNKDNYEKAIEGANRSIDLANLMIQLLILAVAVMGGLGIFSYIRQGQVRKRVEKELDDVRELKQKMEDDFKQEFQKTVDLRSKVENIKTQAETLLWKMTETFKNAEKIREEVEKTGKQIEESKKSIEESKTEVSAFGFYIEGKRFLDQNEYEKAIEKFKKATELSPDYVEAHGNWGYALGKLGRHEEAIKKYKKVIELDPDHALAYLNWGWSLGELDRYEEAIEKLKKAIELSPDFALAWYDIACVYSLQNKKKEALENLKKAIELDPKFREKARKDEDFKNLWEDEDFKRLVE